MDARLQDLPFDRDVHRIDSLAQLASELPQRMELQALQATLSPYSLTSNRRAADT